MINAIDGRIVEKKSMIPGVIPTVAPSFDHTDGTWSATDIYNGEFFINIPDEKVYTRCGSTIVEVTSVASTPPLEDVLAVDNSTGANDIVIENTQKVKSANGLVYEEFSGTTFEQRTTDDLTTPTIINLFQNFLGYMAMQTTNATAGNFSRIQLSNTQLDVISSGVSGATLTKVSLTDSEIKMVNEVEDLLSVTADGLLIDKRYTPTSAADPLGVQGQVTVDDTYIYIKTSTGWKRSAITTF